MYPLILGTGHGNSGGKRTTHPISLPGGTGGTILVLIAFGDDPHPGGYVGWNGTVPPGVPPQPQMLVARAFPGSTASIVANTEQSVGSAHVTYRIFNGSRGIEWGTYVTLTGATPNPPALTPGYGSSESLWIAVAGWTDGRKSVASYPASYGLSQVTDRWNSVNGAGLAAACRDLTAASADPGAFSLSEPVEWMALTVGAQAPITMAASETGLLDDVGGIRWTEGHAIGASESDLLGDVASIAYTVVYNPVPFTPAAAPTVYIIAAPAEGGS